MFKLATQEKKRAFYHTFIDNQINGGSVSMLFCHGDYSRSLENIFNTIVKQCEKQNLLRQIVHNICVYKYNADLNYHGNILHCINSSTENDDTDSAPKIIRYLRGAHQTLKELEAEYDSLDIEDKGDVFVAQECRYTQMNLANLNHSLNNALNENTLFIFNSQLSFKLRRAATSMIYYLIDK
ncbi:MAG: hypothetical protein GY755_21530 [Chloroflexi bacterium]|nr:hypothetical protein [Chloroflexota bacterium]